MYIPEFVCGAITVVLIEVVALIIYAVVSPMKDKRKK